MELYTTAQLFEEGILPSSLRGYIDEVCPDCNLPIVMNEILTYRRCGNPRCKLHMAERADRMFKYLGVKGIGPKTALLMLKMNSSSSHFDLIPLVFKEGKPKVYLYEIALMASIDGLGDEAQELLSGFNSFSTYHASEGIKHPLIINNISTLKKAEELFEIKHSFNKNIIEVMISGNLRNHTKSKFLSICNSITERYFTTKMVGLNNKAMFLITEDKRTSSQKGMLARGELRPGIRIPICTSEEYLQYIYKAVEEIEGTLDKNSNASTYISERS